MKVKITIINAIEIGLNILVQDLIWKSHTQQDIDNYINKFKFIKVKNER